MNAEKCHLIVLKHEENVNINIGSNKISGEKSVKLLGIKIDNNLNFDEHV